ncbi:uncharacterized protein LOC100836707 [Brachypodium distachyon]|uniref:Uncharacterized protein n=1 Tax=Brachypodium distachyon TaxID=15368 RepID=A0A0Q3HEK0_BRADI|nr:uncharacterized protein LOC100836707 [Brachypodium distachyon]KQJ91890.1 hypothetical protein BRADI_4g40364v3 [Brachypodium distachyon]|eukprot:XP_003578792.1 uncharacterized protein LOC100836707 [Brachypodium distachyon]
MAAQIRTPVPLPPLRPSSLPRLRALELTAPSGIRSRRFQVASAVSGGDNSGGGPPAEKGDGKPRGVPSLPALSEIRWGELLVPAPDNAAAVALTGALVWAGASLLLQLVLISASIFAAAVKYSFVAALLLFVLIALL